MLHGDRSRVAIERHVADRLRHLRLLSGRDQRSVAKSVGVSFRGYANYEYGHTRITAGMLFKLADALGVSVNHFFTGVMRDPSIPVVGGFRLNPKARFINEAAKTYDFLGTDVRKGLVRMFRTIRHEAASETAAGEKRSR